MKIQLIEVSKIKPDKNQPRKTIDPSRVEEMAQSIITEGLINPIEVDEKFVIVTGEMRFWACKKAGLKKVHCKIIKISPENRFRRQVIENVHHNSMSDWDTAKSLEKLLRTSPGDIRTVPGGRSDQGITRLATQIGKSRGYIMEHLEILKSSQKIKDAIKRGDLKSSFLRAIREAPEKHQKAMEKKILRKEFTTRDGARSVARAIKENPSKASELMKTDYSKLDTTEKVKDHLKKVIPGYTNTPLKDAFAESRKPSEYLADLTSAVIDWLETHPAKGVGTFYVYGVIEDLVITRRAIDKWLKTGESVKKLKAKN